MAVAEGLVEIVQKNTAPYWSPILKRSPADTEMISILLSGDSTAQITSRNFIRLGAVQFSVQTVASFRVLFIGTDGVLLGRSDPSFLPSIKIGQSFDLNRVPGLEAPFKAALAGETDPKRLYAARVPTTTTFGTVDRFNMAVPIFADPDGVEKKVIGVLVIILDDFPTQRDIPANILNVAGRSLFIFLLEHRWVLDRMPDSG